MAMPDAAKVDGAGGSDDTANDFFMYVFKVQPCPKRGAHDWSSCPYAHPKEKARRRDPRVFKYASTPCPESLKGVHCGRGVDCPYAHSVYEYWLHPSRFRTQMCKKGNKCNRTLCFFAHSASELRFPDTSDDLEAAAVDAAAASATAAPLPLCALAGAGAAAYGAAAGGMVMQPAPLSRTSSSVSGHLALAAHHHGIMGLGAVCADAYGGGSSFGMAAAAPQLVQADALGSSSDPALGVAAAPDAQSLSDPLPRMGSEGAAMAAACSSPPWLPLAAASQLSASQVLGSIQAPSAQQLAVRAQAVGGLLAPGMGGGIGGHQQAAAAAAAASMQQAALARLCASSAALLGGKQQQQHGLDVSAEQQLTASLASMGLVDDNSGSSCMTASSGDHHFLAALAADAAACRPADASLLQRHASGVSSPPSRTASGLEPYMMLQQLQHPQHHHHLVKLGSGSSTASTCALAAGGRQPSSGVFALGGMAPQAAQVAGATWGVRMA